MSVPTAVYKLEIFVPRDYFDAVRQALWEADAGHLGAYDRCLSWSVVQSCWRALEYANPFDGTVGELTQREEIKMEVSCLAENLALTLQAVKAAHPYEEPVIHVLPLYQTGLSIE